MMKNTLNKFIFLLIVCSITTGIDLVFSFLKNRPLFGYNFYSAIFLGFLFWLYYLLSGRLNNWKLIKAKNENSTP